MAACRDPANHRYTPTGGLPELREAIAAKTKRDSGLDVTAGAGAGHQRRQAGGLQHVRRAAATRATRCCCRPRTGPPTPRPSPWPTASRSSCRPTSRAGFRVSVDAARGGGHRAHEGRCCSCRRRTRRAPSTRPTWSPRSAAGRGERGLWVVTDEIYEHLVYGDARHVSMPVVVPELADRCVVLNGVAKTYAMTGWRVGWMIGPGRRDRRGHQPAVPHHVQRGQRVPAGGAGRRVRRPRRRWPRCAPPSTGGAARSTGCSTRSRASPAPSRRGPSTPSRPSRACSAAT